MGLILNNTSGLNSVQQQLVGKVAPAPTPQSTPSGSSSSAPLGDALWFDPSNGQINATSMQSGVARPVTMAQDGIQAPSTSSRITGGGTPAHVGPSSAQVNPLLDSMNSLDTVLGNKNAQTDDEYNRAIQGYNAQDALDKEAYDKNTHTNEQNLTANNQKALLNAANGATGLRGVLASLGGLSGSGVDAIRHLVGLAANDDTGASRQTFDTNASNLNQAWNQTDQQEQQRRADADATHANSLQNNKASVLTSRQSILQQLANLYGAGTAEGDSYASQAGALAPQIADTTRATVAPYKAASSLFSPDALKSYLAGTQNLDAKAITPDATALNSADFNNPAKKEKLSGVA